MEWDAVCRRASGRRHFNAVRRFRQSRRRCKVIDLVVQYGAFTHGTQARVARELGVSESTISRDVRAWKIASEQARRFFTPIVPVVAELRRRDLSLHAIAKELNRRQIKTRTGQRWSASQVRDVLHYYTTMALASMGIDRG